VASSVESKDRRELTSKMIVESKHLAVADIVTLAQKRGLHEIWVNDVGAVTWAQFGIAVAAARLECEGNGVVAGSVVEVAAEERLGFIAWLFGAASVGAVVAPVRRGNASFSPLEQFVRIDWRVVDGRLSRAGSGTMAPASQKLLAVLQGRRHPGLILATGGTTGTPKVVLHDLTALLATVPVKDGHPWRTLALMRFDHIGGLDSAWRALGGRQVLVAPPGEITPEKVAATIERHRVEVLPATPSFLNLLLMADAHRSRNLSSLRVVPYGAEPMPPSLLERLKLALPHVEFVQRFGTSETGSLPVRGVGGSLSLSEKKEGFSWKIVEGELWVRSPARALGYLSGDTGGFDEAGWFHTGDVADMLPDGSMRILGRRTELINVGGEKVLPAEVENALLRHPLIADCRVGQWPNALLGQVVSAEIVWRGPEQDAISVKRQVHEFARDLIARHKLPVVVQLVKSIESTRSLKKSRNVRS